MKNNAEINVLKLLTEGISVYSMEVLIKSDIRENKVEIVNQIRALVGVIVVNVIHSEYLERQKSNLSEYSLLKMKYIVKSTPDEEIKKIRSDAMFTHKIQGLLQFVPRFNTKLKKGSY